MARNLYRVYLYIVFIAMLIFAAVGLGMYLWHYSNQRFNRASHGVFCGVVDHCSYIRNLTLLADQA